MLYSLRDAIARALGVPIELIVIESIQFIKDGVVQTTANVLQGRRLVQTGYNIQYKIVDPPQTLLETPVEQLSSQIQSSPVLASAITNTVYSMTGITIQPESLAIQSEMRIASPVNSTQESVPENGLYFMIGGICVALGLVGVGTVLMYKRRKNRRVADDQMDPVTIIHDMPEPIFYTSKLFNKSVRDIIVHKPQQVRRV